jgi:hypothetical protein
MTPPSLISVINQSQRITNVQAQAMTAAVARQIMRDVSPLYGLVPAIEFVQPGGKPSVGGVPCYLIDVPDVPGAAGYHDEDAQGQAYIKVFANPTLDNGGSVLKGPNSVSVTLSHEILELIGDAPANKWVDGPGGVDFAYELCDAVEGDSYELDGVDVSNFVLQAFFDPRASAGSRFDFMGKLSKPFTMTAGGYQITRTEPGRVAQIFAAHERDTIEAKPGVFVHFGPDVPLWKREAKLAKAARRRGLP